MSIDRFIIEGAIWMLTEKVGLPVYDFDFRQYFDCRTPYEPENPLRGIARIGAFDDYQRLFDEQRSAGIELVHSVEDHMLCSRLPQWYPLIKSDTPRSIWYSTVPTLKEIENDFEFPIFIKGARQTSRHNDAACIVHTRKQYEGAAAFFQTDPILRWQEFVCREYVELRRVPGGIEGKVPASFEFRTFWWRGELVGEGAYWHDSSHYSWTLDEREAALRVAQRAVDILKCTFIVIDLAQRSDGNWIIIECNDGMESGYAGASPFAIWQGIIDIQLRP